MEKLLKPYRIIPQHLYVMRDADRQLKSILDDMASPGYVLVSRQMGKTNLLLNAKRTYQSKTDIFVYIDLSNSFKNEEECFRNIVNKAIDTHLEQLGHLPGRVQEIRNLNLAPHLEHLQELRLILNAVSGKLVIILDEIDALTRSTFSDKIFSQIRSIYFDRSSYEELNRLTYILSGVVEPSEIIKDPKISPFNIGQKIFLDDFSFQETETFNKVSKLNLSRDIVERIFYWANGNPRMTYDIFAEVENLIIRGEAADKSTIDLVIKELYLTNFDRAPVDHIRELVQADKRVRDSITIIRYGKGSQIEDSLKKRLYLAGIIGSDFTAHQLKIKNKIIDESLSPTWLAAIERNTKDVNDLISHGIADGAFQKVVEIYFTAQETELTSYSRYNVGLAFNKLRRFEESIDILKLVNYDRNYELRYLIEHKSLLAANYSQLGIFDKAAELLNEIIAIDKNGKYSLPSKAALADLLLHEFPDNLDEIIKLYNEVIDESRAADIAIDDDYKIDIRTEAYLRLGQLYYQLNRIGDAKLNYQKGLAESSLNHKPFIKYGIYSLEDDLKTKEQLIGEIYSDLLHIDILSYFGSKSYNSSIDRSLYSIVDSISKELPKKIDSLIDFFASTLGNQDEEDLPILYKLGFYAASAKNSELGTLIFEKVLTFSKNRHLPPDLQQSIFQFLLNANSVEKVLTHYANDYFVFLSNNKQLPLTAQDIDLLLALTNRYLENDDTTTAQSLIQFLKVNLVRASENLKPFKYVLEFYEIRSLLALNLTQVARQRSSRLLNDLNSFNLAQHSVHPYLREGLPVIKSALYDVLAAEKFTISNTIEEPLDADRVDVKYTSGVLRTNIRYKKVKVDIQKGECKIIKRY